MDITEFKLGEVYRGFKLSRKTYVGEIKANLYEFEHLKSGAKLLYVDRDDDNKVFSAAFRTTPEDSTGVFHILEHSVLCGSDKYPVKEPFVDLIKGSMQTFLNAFTFPDKTMYPCASCNDKDFSNLMSVYLDAVFAPAIYRRPEIFKQEGWHYELLDKDSDPEFKGVVFNEMKGSYSSVDTHLYSATDAALFPDNFYRFSSGGYPPAITDLTYEGFIAAHRKYYHPENSFLYLYGNMDLDEKLEFIDREYLSKFERTGNVIGFPVQTPVINKDYVAEYAISADEQEEHNYYTALCYVTGSYLDREKNIALSILLDAIASSNESPLKKVFLDKKMADDMWAFLYDGIAQPYAIFQLRKTDPEYIELFEETLIGALREFAEKGVDRTLLLASVNQTEFHLREGKQGGTPAGLSYDLDIMDGWLYGSDPELYVTYEQALINIRAGLDPDSRYFESLIEECFLNSNHMAKVVLKPSKTKQAEDEKAEKDKLHAFKQSLTEEQIEQLIADTNALIEYQSAENTPEELATIPALELSDIGKGRDSLPNEVSKDGDVTYLFHEIDTSGIIYERWYFDTSVIPEDELPYLALLSNVLTECPTANYSTVDLQSEIKIKLGSFGFGNDLYTNVKNASEIKTFFTVWCSALAGGIADSVRLANEVLGGTLFTKDEIKTTLVQVSNSMKNHFINSGSSAAIDKVNSYLTKQGAYNQKIGSFGYYEFVNRLIDIIDGDFDSIKAKLESVLSKLCSPDRLTISISGSREMFESFKAACRDQLALVKTVCEKAKTPEPVYNGNEAVCIPSGVNYSVKACNYLENGFKYSGKLLVLSKILSNDYLWNEIRVKGGAYGTGFIVRETGFAGFYSYRDPNVSKTLDNYDRAIEYLENFKESGQGVLKYIISTIAGIDHPISPRSMGGYIDGSYFSGSDLAYKAKIREEVLSTTEDDIVGFAALIRAIKQADIVCTVGVRTKIEEAKDVYTSIKDL